MKALKQVDVVISTVGAAQVMDQSSIVAAIKEVGHIKVSSLNKTTTTTKSFFFYLQYLVEVHELKKNSVGLVTWMILPHSFV